MKMFGYEIAFRNMQMKKNRRLKSSCNGPSGDAILIEIGATLY